MEDVVVLSWDRATRRLVYVPVNGGDGGDRLDMAVPPDSVSDVDEACAGGLPRRGTLEFDDEVCLLELSGPLVRQCKATYSKSKAGKSSRRDSRHMVIHLREGDKHLAEVPAERVGLVADNLAHQAKWIGSFLWFGVWPTDGILGCWTCPGGLSGWIEARTQQRAEEDAAKEAKAAAREARAAAEAAKTRFVNPYTFVPFPERIDRQAPAGHAALGPGRLSGSLRVEFTFTSPMQAPEGTVEGERLRLPGASLKGAIRSLHETLAGGCLRVLDEEFVPSYRDVVVTPSSEWTLGVVESTTRDGQPLRVLVCDEVVWVRAEQLRAACGARLQSGSRVSVPSRWTLTSLGRNELDSDAAVSAGGDWVVLLSDPGARRGTTENGRSPAYFAACGRLRPTATMREVDDQAWRTFKFAVAGARELMRRQAHRRRDPAATLPEWVEVKFNGMPIGRRRPVTGAFEPGDVLWVRRGPADPAGGPGRVNGLSLAAVWRHLGAGPLGARVPAHLRPCPPEGSPGDPDLLLCPSCRLFGAADVTARGGDDDARQRSYAGHVRFGDAVSDGPVEMITIQRAPMGAPRPGAGQFYLRYEDTSPAVVKDERPTREWGSRPDGEHGERPRPVRGRKYYWPADPTVQQPPRHKARKHQTNADMVSSRHLAPAGTALSARLAFDNLSPAEIGGLLASLQPHLVLPKEGPGSRPASLRLGGGKPLGLGICVARVSELRVWSAASRYGGAATVSPDPDAYVAAFTASTPAEVCRTWPALTAVLSGDGIDATRVWYPPGAYWPDHPDGGPAKKFDEPFAFFLGTSGMYMAGKAQRPLVPLPEPTEDDQSLAIIRKEDIEEGAGERGHPGKRDPAGKQGSTGKKSPAAARGHK